MHSQNNQFLESAIVSTGSDITNKVEMNVGISKTARLYLAKDILCAMITAEASCYLDLMPNNIKDAYAIADMLIKEGGL